MLARARKWLLETEERLNVDVPRKQFHRGGQAVGQTLVLLAFTAALRCWREGRVRRQGLSFFVLDGVAKSLQRSFRRSERPGVEWSSLALLPGGQTDRYTASEASRNSFEPHPREVVITGSKVSSPRNKRRQACPSLSRTSRDTTHVVFVLQSSCRCLYSWGTPDLHLAPPKKREGVTKTAFERRHDSTVADIPITTRIQTICLAIHWRHHTSLLKASPVVCETG